MLYFLTEKKQKGAYKNMSQAKVDRYKEEKKNRKQTIKKEKRNRVLGRTLGVVIAAAIVCWIGFSGYSYYQEKKPMTKTELGRQTVFPLFWMQAAMRSMRNRRVKRYTPVLHRIR